MATINLGAIKFNWRGAYAGGTAYTVDDVVSSGGSSYVCILASTGNAVSNATYWSVMAQAGTDGTDLTSTLTTQGDTLYRDGSGLARLGFGTSGHVLTTKGTGANPAWEAAVGGKIGQVVITTKTDTASVNATTFTDMTGMSVAITPTATSSRIYLTGSMVINNSAQYAWWHITRDIGGGGYSTPTGFVGDARGSRVQTTGANIYLTPDAVRSLQQTVNLIDSPSTTSACTYKLQVRQSSGSSTTYLNRSSTDADTTAGHTAVSTLIAMEVLA